MNEHNISPTMTGRANVNINKLLSMVSRSPVDCLLHHSGGGARIVAGVHSAKHYCVDERGSSCKLTRAFYCN